MENLRWILLVAGFAILLLLYFSGRPRKERKYNSNKTSANRGDRERQRGSLDPTQSHLERDPTLNSTSSRAHREASGELPVDRQATGVIGGGARHGEGSYAGDDGFAVDPDDLVRPAGGPYDVGTGRDDLLDPEVRGITREEGSSTSISSRIESFSSRLSPKRKSRVAASAPKNGPNDDAGDTQKIVSLHVVSPNQQLIRGEHLLDVFEFRGYHFGDMNIFHSLHEGKTVFSIAKAVKPGTFDINDVRSFDTPGITLILQLPGPVAGDVAFEVLLDEAQELATALGCRILDGDRSTLTKQTVQHLREGVYEYMHRQKYFSKATGPA